jgi:hypothetical protein
MNKREFSMWAMALKTFFPRDNLLPTPEAMELWYQELKDIPYAVATAMLRKWANTQKWPPTIAEVRTMCAELSAGKLPEWGDAWQEVQKAIGKFGYIDEEGAIDSMSPLTVEAVEKIGWRAICFSENPDTIRAQFRQVFQICANREIEDRQLTPELKETIRNLLPDNKLLQLEGEIKK